MAWCGSPDRGLDYDPLDRSIASAWRLSAVEHSVVYQITQRRCPWKPGRPDISSLSCHGAGSRGISLISQEVPSRPWKHLYK